MYTYIYICILVCMNICRLVHIYLYVLYNAEISGVLVYEIMPDFYWDIGWNRYLAIPRIGL